MDAHSEYRGKGSGRRRGRGRRTALIVLLCCLSVVLLSALYVGDYYRAVDVEGYLQGGDGVEVSRVDSGWFFDGPGGDTALIFYPGAKVECTAYAPLMRLLAKRGVDCFLEEMPLNLAIFDGDRADTVMAEYSYDNWYLSGHSLGGSIAASHAAKHMDRFSGIILLAAYPTRSLQGEDFSVLSIYGSEDRVLNHGNMEAARKWMPENYTELCIRDGNHAWFGSYGEQRGDGRAGISHEEQWQQTADAVLSFVR